MLAGALAAEVNVKLADRYPGARPDQIERMAKAGPYVGPRGGLWADPMHTVHWEGEAASGAAGADVAEIVEAGKALGFEVRTRGQVVAIEVKSSEIYWGDERLDAFKAAAEKAGFTGHPSISGRPQDEKRVMAFPPKASWEGRLEEPPLDEMFDVDETLAMMPAMPDGSLVSIHGADVQYVAKKRGEEWVTVQVNGEVALGEPLREATIREDFEEANFW